MIDTHCHILKEDYDNQEEVIKNMKDSIIIVIKSFQSLIL